MSVAVLYPWDGVGTELGRALRRGLDVFMRGPAGLEEREAWPTQRWEGEKDRHVFFRLWVLLWSVVCESSDWLFQMLECILCVKGEFVF